MPRHRGVKGGANFTSATIVEAGSTQGFLLFSPEGMVSLSDPVDADADELSA